MKLPFKIPANLGTTAWIGITLLSATACVPSKTQEIWGDNYGRGAASNQQQGSPPLADEYQQQGGMNVGQGSDRNRINIPAAPGATRAAASIGNPAMGAARGAGPTTHVVVTGDTLWGLGIKYGVTVEQIQEANQLNGAFIKAGQNLRIP